MCEETQMKRQTDGEADRWRQMEADRWTGTDGETDRGSGRWMERQTDGEADRWRDRKMDRQTDERNVIPFYHLAYDQCLINYTIQTFYFQKFTVVLNVTS